MTEETRLSIKEKQDIEYVVNLSEMGKPMPLNLKDDIQYRFYMRQLELAGVTSETYPQLFRSIEESRAIHRQSGIPQEAFYNTELGIEEAQEMNLITELGPTDEQQFFAAGLSSIIGGSNVTHLTLGLYDHENNPLGTVAQQVEYNSGENFGITVATQNSSRYVKAVMTYFYELRSGKTISGTVSMATESYPKMINHEDPMPVRNPQKNYTKVCLNRNASDCDYCLVGGRTNVIFPIKGSINYNGNIDPIQFDSQGHPINAYASISITRTEKGGGCFLIEKHNFFKHENTIIKDHTLSWDLEPGEFGEACFGSGDDITFTMYVSVPVERKGVMATITNAPGTSPDYNTKIIPPIHIFWGCLAEGTKILMADGREKVIEDIEVLEKIVSDQKDTNLTIENTTIGIEEKPCIMIEDEQGHKLILSDGHPVMTPEGVVLAKLLRVGDEVCTVNGDAKLVKIQEIDYERDVWNLDVGMQNDGVELTEDNTTFYANGILVGDAKMQRTFIHRHKHYKETVLESIPEKWHQDYFNHIALNNDK